MLRKITLSAIAMSSIHAASAQDSAAASSITLSGLADMYYRYDFGKSKINDLTSFTRSHNSFELGMASVKLDYKTPRVELVADLGLGKRAQEFSYNDEGVLAAVKQLYISYTPNEWLKFTAGSWATHIGYELADANANRNYSMSYLFTNGPFFHTGIKAEVVFQSNGFMIGLTNPADFKYVPDGFTNNKFIIAQYSFAPGDFFKAYLNYAGGEGPDTSISKQFDVVLSLKLGSRLRAGYNGTYSRVKAYLGNKLYDDEKSWWGSALYINFDPASNIGLTLRQEYFSDKKRLKVYGAQPEGGSVWATTLSAPIKVDNLIFIPEFRLDKASKSLFTNKDSKPTKTSANILFAAIYAF